MAEIPPVPGGRLILSRDNIIGDDRLRLPGFSPGSSIPVPVLRYVHRSIILASSIRYLSTMTGSLAHPIFTSTSEYEYRTVLEYGTRVL